MIERGLGEVGIKSRQITDSEILVTYVILCLEGCSRKCLECLLLHLKLCKCDSGLHNLSYEGNTLNFYPSTHLI